MDILSSLISGVKRGFKRLAVVIGRIGFFEGREFRMFYEFDIPAGQTLVLRFNATVDFILYEQSLVLNDGEIRFSAVAGDGTPSGTFDEPILVIGKNRMASRPLPYYENQNTIDTGITAGHTGGVEVEVFTLLTSNATAKQTTVGGVFATERGLPIGQTYLRFHNPGAGTAKGIYSIYWEELPEV